MAATHPMKPGTYTVSSPFGPRWGTHHNGQDFAAPLGTPIYATEDGVIIEGKDRAPGSVGGFGNWIWQDSQKECGRDFIYGHMRHHEIYVRKGDRVKAGQLIARVGSEGGSTGPHLHFEEWTRPGRLGGRPVDPAPRLRGAASPGGAAPAPAPAAPTAPVRAATAVAANVLDWSARFIFGKPRPTHQIKNIIIHVTVNAPGTPAENVANYQISSQSGSYHELTDTTIKHLIENTDDWFTWSSGNYGNDVGLHRSFVLWGTETRVQWLQYDRMLREAAKRDAEWCRKYNIPPVKLSAADLRAGKKGFAGHLETGQAWGGTDHVDPGTGFPWDIYLGYVRDYLNGTPQKEEGDVLTTKFFTDFLKGFIGPVISDVKDIRQQFTGGRDAGEYPGWSISQLVKNYQAKPGDSGTVPEMLAVALTEIHALREDVNKLKEGR